MGMGCSRVMERVAAATGLLQDAPTQFERNSDVVNGGVLCSLPALLMNGLLRHTTDHFNLPKGYYGLVQVFLLLGYMALARVKNIEQLRYCPAGEWGRLLGLDRIPEVRTLRSKVKYLTTTGSVDQWSCRLSKDWMESEPEAAGILYVDGHVRVYHGSQTKLPRRYVARQRLCLRGMTDYWVNDQQGRPFFVLSTPFTSGLLDMLKREIVPRLLQDVPNQPSEQELEADPYLYRFVIIIDREGYSPEFFRQMWQKRIACQTYNKYPKEDWPTSEFAAYDVRMGFGQQVKMQLAERGVLLAKELWVREIRKLTETGHQVSILSLDYKSDLRSISGHMFSRWSQENFFKYMMEHFDIEALSGYQTESVDETRKVVNPAYRTLENKIKSKSAKLSRMKVGFYDVGLKEELSSESIAEYGRRKGDMKEQMDMLEKDIEELKQKRKQTSKHLPLAELPEEERFMQLSPKRKQFIDTIKMIAYRAESAMAVVLRDVMARADDIRPLLREIFTTEADLIPNQDEQTLTVALHHLTNSVSDEAARKLFEYLNATETIYPGTNLRLVYKLVSDLNPPGQVF